MEDKLKCRDCKKTTDRKYSFTVGVCIKCKKYLCMKCVVPIRKCGGCAAMCRECYAKVQPDHEPVMYQKVPSDLYYTPFWASHIRKCIKK